MYWKNHSSVNCAVEKTYARNWNSEWICSSLTEWVGSYPFIRPKVVKTSQKKVKETFKWIEMVCRIYLVNGVVVSKYASDDMTETYLSIECETGGSLVCCHAKWIIINMMRETNLLSFELVGLRMRHSMVHVICSSNRGVSDARNLPKVLWSLKFQNKHLSSSQRCDKINNLHCDSFSSIRKLKCVNAHVTIRSRN